MIDSKQTLSSVPQSGFGIEVGADVEATTHFGFQTVRRAEKQHLVREVFDSVAEKYDLMNDLMSAGVHRLWKNRFIDLLNPRPGMRLLDVAGGTGDIAFRFLQTAARQAKAKQAKDERAATVTVCDINAAMLNVGRDRAVNRNILHDIAWVGGDAQQLPFPDASFDAYTIAFGLRNVTDIAQALREARRILKPGGHFMCLEFSKVTIPGLDKIYDLYSFSILPRMGQVIAHNRQAYQYLAESIRQFPSQDTMIRHLKDAGFGQTKYHNLSGGIAAIHSGWRL